MPTSRRITTSPLTRAAWFVRFGVLVLGLLVLAASVQQGGQGWILVGLFAGGIPAGWASLDLAVRSCLRQGWRVAAVFGIALFLVSGSFLLGDLWRTAVGSWQSAVVADESSHCTGRYSCVRTYSVTLVGMPGVVAEDHQGQYPVGSTVRLLVDPTGLVGPSPDGERDRLGWSSVMFVVGAAPQVVVSVAAFRRSRRSVSTGPPW